MGRVGGEDKEVTRVGPEGLVSFDLSLKKQLNKNTFCIHFCVYIQMCTVPFPWLSSIHLCHSHRPPVFLVSYIFFWTLCKYKEVQFYFNFSHYENMLFMAQSSSVTCFSFIKFKYMLKQMQPHPPVTQFQQSPGDGHYVKCFIKISCKVPWACSFVVGSFLMINSLNLTWW